VNGLESPTRLEPRAHLIGFGKVFLTIAGRSSRPILRRNHGWVLLPPATEVPVLKISAAIAFACTILLISDTSQARPRLRLSSSTAKPAAVMPPKPAAAAPAPQRSSGGLYIAVGSRPAAATSDRSAQRAFDDPAKGPLQFDPTLGSADAEPPAASTDDKAPAPLMELAAAPASECVAGSAKEKEKMAANEPARVEPVRSRAAFLVPVAREHRQAPAPHAVVVCYVHRDGSCKPY
jgi:hypothetical protein